MKKIRSILALALLCMMPLSCLQESGIQTEDPDGEGIVLDIRCLDPQTRMRICSPPWTCSSVLKERPIKMLCSISVLLPESLTEMLP